MSNLPTLPQKGIMSLVDSASLSAVESALAMNDLSKLTTDQRVSYYNAVCASVGLNPLTQPFAYIVLDGKLTLYARKECSEQLRKINSVSTQILEKVETDEFYEVHARAGDRSGRVEEDFASVYLYDKYGKKLTGMNLANAKMKCVTKAKRRVTLAISGLGVLDESELESIDQSKIKVTENPQVPNQFKDVPKIDTTEKIDAQNPADEKIVDAQSVVENSADYVIKFGKKYKDQKIKDVATDDHKEMISWLEKEQEKGNYKIKSADEYLFHAKNYVNRSVDESDSMNF